MVRVCPLAKLRRAAIYKLQVPLPYKHVVVLKSVSCGRVKPSRVPSSFALKERRSTAQLVRRQELIHVLPRFIHPVDAVGAQHLMHTVSLPNLLVSYSESSIGIDAHHEGLVGLHCVETFLQTVVKGIHFIRIVVLRRVRGRDEKTPLAPFRIFNIDPCCKDPVAVGETVYLRITSGVHPPSFCLWANENANSFRTTMAPLLWPSMP